MLVLVPGVMIILYHCFWGALLENIYHSRKMALEHIILRLLRILYWYLQYVQIQYIVHKTSNNFRFAMLNLAQQKPPFSRQRWNHGGWARGPGDQNLAKGIQSWNPYEGIGPTQVGRCRHGAFLFGGSLGYVYKTQFRSIYKIFFLVAHNSA